MNATSFSRTNLRVWMEMEMKFPHFPYRIHYSIFIISFLLRETLSQLKLFGKRGRIWNCGFGVCNWFDQVFPSLYTHWMAFIAFLIACLPTRSWNCHHYAYELMLYLAIATIKLCWCCILPLLLLLLRWFRVLMVTLFLCVHAVSWYLNMSICNFLVMDTRLYTLPCQSVGR